ncbi:DUF454 family protein [Bacteroides sp. CR5/BHMF/2]|nr:DUF454 family protein [Bacteroides sp. CR5/BHMF/2]
MKTLYIVLGSISLALGILGIFLPLLPTTPFLLLTAALYFKGSPDYITGCSIIGTSVLISAITAKTRRSSSSQSNLARADVGTMLYCIFFLIPLIWVKILPGLIAAGVTYHILSFKTLK